ncbi:pseudouridine synthase [Zhouia sp. PK063]|uniref:pseudouridine synthase n=1 Tax=Zhouia sp. PK063 TaxID=3373602 RepID=UPI0037A7AEFC
MSRSDNSRDGKQSGRQGGGKRKSSYARGNAPIKKRPAFKSGGQSAKKDSEIRLNKYIANSGVCSRRDADIYIVSGNVTVNGNVVTELGYKVQLTDEVKFDGRLINPEKKAYVLLNKPKGFVTTTSVEKERSVMDLVANATKSRIQPVGRLERGTTGLLLFTNDSDLMRKLSQQENHIRKIYHVILDKNLSFEDLKKIQEGLLIDQVKVEVDEISYVDGSPKREIGIKIQSNKNRIVRRIFEQLGYEVEQLDRVVFAGLTKKDLPRGTWRHLTQQEVINLGML